MIIHDSNFKPMGGPDNPINVELSQVIKEVFSGSATVTHNFTKPMQGFVISNDGAGDLTFTINSLTLTVKAGEVFEGTFETFTSVTVTTTVAYRAYGLTSGAEAAQTVVTPPTDTVAPANAGPITTSFVTQSSVTLNWPASVSIDVANYDVYRGTTLLTNTASTSYTVTGLTAATDFTFVVKARDNAGNVASGTSITVTTSSVPSGDTTPPAEASAPTVTNLTHNSLTLNWTASPSSDIKDYRIYNGASLLGTVTATTVNLTALSPNTAYTFTIKSRDTSNNESTGIPVSTTTSAAPADATAPTDGTLTTASVAQTTLTLNWTAATDNVAVTGYDVYQASTLLGSVTSSTLTYSVTGLTAGTQYTFSVKAKDAAANISTGASVTVTTATAADATAPTDGTLTTASVTQTTLTLNWTAATDNVAVTGYDVYQATTLLGSVTSSTLTYSVTGLTAATPYTFTVKAKDAAANISTGATTTVTTNAAAATIVLHDFNGADNASSLGTANTGQTWTSLGGTYGISSNQAACTAAAVDGFTVIESGKSDGEVQITFSTINVHATQGSRMYFRVVDANNLFLVQAYNSTAYIFYKKVSGTYTDLGSSAGITPANGDVIKAVLNGSSITLYINGVQAFSVTETANQTATKHGFGVNNVTTPRWDDFRVVG